MDPPERRSIFLLNRTVRDCTWHDTILVEVGESRETDQVTLEVAPMAAYATREAGSTCFVCGTPRPSSVGLEREKGLVQIFGGLGCMDEKPVSRYYRDIRATTIGCVE